jgi:hypothetical protein
LAVTESSYYPLLLSQRQDKEEMHKIYSKLYSLKKSFKLVHRKEKARKELSRTGIGNLFMLEGCINLAVIK